MLGAVVDLDGDVGVRDHLGRIEHAQAESRHEQPLQRPVHRVGLDQSEPDRTGQVDVAVSAVEVATGVDGGRACLLGRLDALVVQVDVADGAAVGDHVPGEAPLVAEDISEQLGVGAAGLAVGAVVGAHDRLDPPLPDDRFECGEIRLAQVALVGDRVKLVP